MEQALNNKTDDLVQDFKQEQVDLFIMVAGLGLIRDATKACKQGDPEACKWLDLVERFLEQVRKKAAH